MSAEQVFLSAHSSLNPVGDAVFQEKARQEQLLLQPYTDVLSESISASQLNQFMLYRATMSPESIQPYLSSARAGGGRSGIIQYIREQSVPIAKPEIFQTLERHVQGSSAGISRDLHRAKLFWAFVVLMFSEEGVTNMVRRTWSGSERLWETSILPYYKNRRDDLLQSPVSRQNGDQLLITLWNVVRLEVAPFNVRAMLLTGVLRPVTVILSRNALRARKGDLDRESMRRRAVIPSTDIVASMDTSALVGLDVPKK